MFIFNYNQQQLLKDYLRYRRFIMQLLLSDVNECRQFPCQNNGTCYNFDGGFNCTCTPGFTGALCEIGKDSVIEFLFYFKIVNRITIRIKSNCFFRYQRMLVVSLSKPRDLHQHPWFVLLQVWRKLGRQTLRNW